MRDPVYLHDLISLGIERDGVYARKGTHTTLSSVVLEHTVCASRATAPLARLYPGFSIDFQSDDPARSSERYAPSRGGTYRARPPLVGVREEGSQEK